LPEILAILAATLPLSAACGQTRPPVAGLAVIRAEESARIQTIRKVSPAVAALFPPGTSAGGGSGVIIDPDGYGLTNFHVVAPMLRDRAGEAGLPDGRRRPLEVLGIDPGGDLAMFRLPGDAPAPSVPLGDSDRLQVGDACLAMGNPFVLADDFTPTVTFGIISGLHRYQGGEGRALVYTDCIQVDTSINPGNSGGPLFDMAGRLIGINGRISAEERGRVNVGVGFAITIHQARRFIPALRAGLTVRHAAAGFTVADAASRVLVQHVPEESAAHRAGIRPGDELVRFGGRDIRSANEFLSILGTFPAGWPVEAALRRRSSVLLVRYRLDPLPLPDFGPKPRRGNARSFDPDAPHPVTQAANRRAVIRLFGMFRDTIGGPEALRSLSSIRATGRRLPADRPGDDPAAIELVERREDDAGGTDRATALERSIRWALMTHSGTEPQEGDAVVGVDEVRGEICAVVKRVVPGGGECRLALDDDDGRLLAVDVADPDTGRALRYEYGDYRRCGALRLPHRRWVIVDGRPLAAEEFDRITVTGVDE
jgi:S1-C subfamily serine protease